MMHKDKTLPTGFQETNPVKQVEAKFQSVVDHVLDGIITINEKGVVESFNPAAEQIFGYVAAEVIGQNVKMLMPEPDRANHDQYIANYLNTGEKKIIGIGREVVGRRKDGTTFPMDLAVSEFQLGKHRMFTGIVRDITERKRVEAERDELLARERAARIEADQARQRLAFLFQAMSTLLEDSLDYSNRLRQLAQIVVPAIADWCAIDIVNADGSVQGVVMVHRDPAKVELAHELARRYPPDPNSPGGVPNVLRTGQAEIYPEISDAALVAIAQDDLHLQMMRKLGLKSALIVPLVARGRTLGAITLVMAESGHRYGSGDLNLASDLAHRAALLIDNARLLMETQKLNAELEKRVEERTAQLKVAIEEKVRTEERLRAKEALAQKAEELARSNAELEKFAYVASHDLQEPLRKVKNFTELLARRYQGKLDAKADKYIAYIVDGADRMRTLISDLLTYSRVGRIDTSVKPIDMREVLNQTLSDIEPSIRRSKAVVTFDYLPTITANPSQMRQLLQNLLINAIKFRSVAPPRIHISAVQKGEEWRFSVKDNGIGIESQYTDRIFVIFQRLHTPSEYPGTGIGLAICKKIVERQGGRIWVESESGKGSTFYFSLPVKGDAETIHQ